MDMTDLLVMGLPSFKAALLLHIVGAMLLFAALGLEALTIFLLRRASVVEQIRDAAAIGKCLPAVFGASGALILLSGIYLGYLNWAYQEELGWVAAAFAFFIAISIAGSLTGRALMRRLEKELAESGGSMTSGLRRAARNARSVIQLGGSACLTLGILAVMIVQPSTLVTILVLLGSLLLGLCLGAWISLLPVQTAEETTVAY